LKKSATARCSISLDKDTSSTRRGRFSTSHGVYSQCRLAAAGG
jgi:hypothetical protein